ncbi:MAG: response regulator, partial [Kiritimatiellae bacterium]|nr:response regulator [Kiritimatiellia bacterium]
MGKILLVDDEKNFCAVLRQILTIKGHDVSVAGTVADAMEEIEKGDLDLVVSDIRMQPLSGLFLLQELQSNKPELPVIMMTAYASVDTALEALKMGAYDYLTKPFKVEEFIEVIDRALV